MHWGKVELKGLQFMADQCLAASKNENGKVSESLRAAAICLDNAATQIRERQENGILTSESK